MLYCWFHMQSPAFSEFLDLTCLLKRYCSPLLAGIALVRLLYYALKQLSDEAFPRYRRCFTTLQHVPCVGPSIRSSFCCINPIPIFRYRRRTRETCTLSDDQPTVRDAGENSPISLSKLRLSILQRKFVVGFITEFTSLVSWP